VAGESKVYVFQAVGSLPETGSRVEKVKGLRMPSLGGA
jgi:hypothetical protein